MAALGAAGDLGTGDLAAWLFADAVAERIRWQGGRCAVCGGVIEFLPETASTNDDLAARLRGGERVAEGHWLVADRQTGGKGRHGRSWADAEGNFMGSTLVYLSGQESAPASLALVAGLAAYEAVLPHLSQQDLLKLKWPNDLLLGNAKLAGILLERVGDAVVIGIGVNLASAPQVQGRATAALVQQGPAPNRDFFADQLAFHMDRELGRWRNFGLEPLIARWLAAAHPEGTQLSVNGPGGEVLSGTFAGLTSEGALRLRLADGAERVIHAGEVQLEGG
jgi:BirA family biotin operon repressor/biotin-[acetyl-CoA-carboxylase] ligase